MKELISDVTPFLAPFLYNTLDVQEVKKDFSLSWCVLLIN